MAEMKAIKVEDIQFYFNQSKKAKDDVRPTYQEVLDLSSTLKQIKDDGTKDFQASRTIEITIVDAIESMQSFVMSSIFSRSGNWASAEIDAQELIDEGVINQSAGADVEDAIKTGSEKTFKYIQQSNYYNEINKAMWDCIVLGTGAFKIVETGRVIDPFVFMYQSLDNLQIYEDSLSRANIVFKGHYQVNGTYIKDVFGADVTLPEGISEEDREATTTIFECVVPDYDETTGLTSYNVSVRTEDLQTVLKEETKEYNPWTVFRWGNIQNSPWGEGLGIKCLQTMKDLKGFKESRKTQVERIVNPVWDYIGEKSLYYHLSSKPGDFNYLGDPSLGKAISYQPSAYTAIPLAPIDQDIEMAKREIRDLFLVLPLGDIQDTKYQTATTIQIRHDLFRQRFSSVYESINEELLKPTFLTPFKILVGLQKIKVDIATIDYTTVKYVNELTKSADLAMVNSIISFTQMIVQLQQNNPQGTAYKTTVLAKLIADKLGIPSEALYKEEEIQQLQSAEYQRVLAGLQQTDQQMEGGAIPPEVAAQGMTGGQ